MICNLRARLPNAQFFGITLSNENFLKRHGSGAFPLLASGLGVPVEKQVGAGLTPHWEAPRPEYHRAMNPMRRMLHRVPGLVSGVRGVRGRCSAAKKQFDHTIGGYHALRGQQLLVISGGGQLDDEYGGPWRLPFALFKWSLLARIANVPVVLASVGASPMKSWISRRLTAAMLRLCRYRSYREGNSRQIVASILRKADSDPIVPDLAFTLPASELPSETREIRERANGRTIIAISPMAFAKPGNWPTPNRALHERYLKEMRRLLSILIARGHFVVLACSSLGDDETVIPELLKSLDEQTKSGIETNFYLPNIREWREYVAAVQEADYLVASRLHATILGLIAQKPAIAISFDPKVDWVMELTGQTDYLMKIHDFTAEDVLRALARAEGGRSGIVEQLRSYRREVLRSSAVSAKQYDLIASIALQRRQLN